MGNKKHKKKRNNKQHFESNNKVPTLNASTSNELEDKCESVKNEEKEESRTNRSGIILAILALMIPLVGVLFHYTKKWGRVLPEKLNVLTLLHIITIGIVMAFSIVVLLDIIFIVWTELKRYDVLRYGREDIKIINKDSDVNYNNLLKDFEIFIYGFLSFVLIISLFVLIYETVQSVMRALLGIACAFLIFSLIISLRNSSKKRNKVQKKQGHGTFGVLIPKLLFALAIVVGTIIYSWFEVKQVIKVNNSSEGLITIDNYGVFPGEVVSIEILKGKDAIFSKDVSGSEFKEANEQVIYNIELKKDEPIRYLCLDRQMNYYRYVFDLKSIALNEGDYRYKISVSKYNTIVGLISDFTKEKSDEYIFAQTLLEKEY